MSSRQHGAQHPAEDSDPTGVRSLLASLPDPGPMPEHVVLRIRESLAQEQSRRGISSAGAAPHPAEPAELTELTELGTRRQRRHQERARRAVPRWAPWVGAAAAVAAGTLVVSAQFLGGAPMADLTASVGTAQRAGDDAEAGGGGLEAAEDEAGGEQGEGGGSAGAVVELDDRTGTEVETLLRDWYAGGPGASPWHRETATTCLSASRLEQPELGEPGAYPATWQEHEAVVLLLPSAKAAEEAWVVEAGCLQGQLSQVLHGPVQLDQR